MGFKIPQVDEILQQNNIQEDKENGNNGGDSLDGGDEIVNESADIITQSGDIDEEGNDSEDTNVDTEIIDNKLNFVLDKSTMNQDTLNKLLLTSPILGEDQAIEEEMEAGEGEELEPTTEEVESAVVAMQQEQYNNIEDGERLEEEEDGDQDNELEEDEHEDAQPPPLSKEEIEELNKEEMEVDPEIEEMEDLSTEEVPLPKIKGQIYEPPLSEEEEEGDKINEEELEINAEIEEMEKELVEEMGKEMEEEEEEEGEDRDEDNTNNGEESDQEFQEDATPTKEKGEEEGEDWKGFHVGKDTSPAKNIDIDQLDNNNPNPTESQSGHSISELQNSHNDYQGDGYNDKFKVLHPKGDDDGSGSNGGTHNASAAMVLLPISFFLCLCCIWYKRRRRNPFGSYGKHPRGRYSALGSDDWKGTFSDDISFGGKSSDNEDNDWDDDYDSDEENGHTNGTVKLEMGEIHEMDANGGLSLEEVNG